MMGISFQALEDVLKEQFRKKGDAVWPKTLALRAPDMITTASNFKPFSYPLPKTENRYAILSGNTAMAHGRRGRRREVLFAPIQ